MRDTAENRNAVQAVVRQIAGRFGGGFPLDPDYATETGRVLLAECPTVAVLSSVASELRQFDRIPHAREIEALARNARGMSADVGCEKCDGTGYIHETRWLKDPCSTDGTVTAYDYAIPCSCRDGGGR